ncbi:MalY/PatB family protein [Marinobacter confluentis]|uniref:cysteine-S-conjugate beta-lyase n=1 Tax=Marinobacter confluentis TaxID=1697557 RepID=A0A4Z1BW99_9GAMM|nr:PatB family C-S lyase [Marinobacter confluentis]TGN38940.1 putative C-S lyase [Marinobacter confluentis]
MSSKFDQPISRENTGAVKYDARQAVFGRHDVIPLWVADMDFAAPDAVVEALEQRARHPAYGYTLYPDSVYEAMIRWYEARHQWRIDRDWILLVPGVVPSLHAAAMAFSSPGDGIIIQPPVYPPFFDAIRKTGRQVIENPLVEDDGTYRMDLGHLDACAAREDAKILLLCSPHNPVGRVWSRDELSAVLDIAQRHSLMVVSDEIHCDLVFPDKTPHQMLGRLINEGDSLITTLAPSKTFNLPGLGLSALVVPNPEHRAALKTVFDSMHMLQCNPFSMTGFEAGYRHGSLWLDELLAYLQQNRDFVVRTVNADLPGITAIEPEGCYLVWLDCRELGMSDSQLKAFFVEDAGVGLNPGITFGQQGSGFMRLNLACPKGTLETALDKIRVALENR